MPRFTLIKHADDEKDTNVTVTFREDHLPELRQKIDEFLRGSGFYWSDSEEDDYDPLPKGYSIVSQDQWDWGNDDKLFFTLEDS